MTSSFTIQCDIQLSRRAHGRKVITSGSQVQAELARGRVPRIARLMALAIHLDGLIRRRDVKDYAEISRLGHVTRARVTQIMNLLLLAPDIQEAILHLPSAERGRDGIHLRDLQPITAFADWATQRDLWSRLVAGLAR